VSRRWGTSRPAGHTVRDSVVLGDVVQLSGVDGDVTISRERPPYRLSEVPAAAIPLSEERARAQPSRLLLARHRIVPFAGRRALLHDLAHWSDDAQEMSVRLIHAAGGQGKTRLAAEVATRRAAEGWAVWQATHATTGTRPSTLPMPTRAAAVIVDYADRWPASALLTLLTQLRQVGQAATVPIRVLLLARSAGYWWQAVSDRVESDLAVPADQLELTSLTFAEDADALFAEAAARFATILAGRPVQSTPHQDKHDHILALHMAALAFVEAQRRGDHAPAEPQAVSAYLLRREAAYWHHLHTRAESPLPTSPSVMHRAVYTASMTGAVSRAEARDALSRTALATDIPAADRILDDHRTCYPPSDRATVLESLHPDRLAEDLIALTTPGHPHHDGSFPTDDWALTAPAALVANEADAPAAITTLVETARRWPHVATAVLFPLVAQRPDLAIAAGGTTLARLAGIEGIDPAVLEAIEAVLPPARRVDFDIAAATISTVLTDHRLAHTPDPTERALLHGAHAARLSAVGRYEEAVAASERATAIYGLLTVREPSRYRASLAGALHDLGVSLSQAGRVAEALQATEQAVEIRRRLIGPEHAAPLATSLSNLGIHLGLNGRLAEALPPAYEALAIHRELVQADRAGYLGDLASSLNNLGIRLAKLGRHSKSLAPAEEAVAVYRELLADDPEGWLPDFAEALINLGNRLASNDRIDEAVRVTREATDICRRLATTNPGGWLSHVAGSLNNLGNRLAAAGRPVEAADAAAEAVAIYRDLDSANPTAWRGQLAMALNNLGNRLSVLEPPESDAVRASEEAIAILRDLAGAHPEAQLPDLATALRAHAMICVNIDTNLETAAERAAEAVGLFLALALKVPEAFAQKLYDATQTQAEVLEKLGPTTEADEARYRIFPRRR
jgi:tetratricopeptide (TPR) repeat protein